MGKPDMTLCGAPVPDTLGCGIPSVSPGAPFSLHGAPLRNGSAAAFGTACPGSTPGGASIVPLRKCIVCGGRLTRRRLQDAPNASTCDTLCTRAAKAGRSRERQTEAETRAVWKSYRDTLDGWRE